MTGLEEIEGLATLDNGAEGMASPGFHHSDSQDYAFFFRKMAAFSFFTLAS